MQTEEMITEEILAENMSAPVSAQEKAHRDNGVFVLLYANDAGFLHANEFKTRRESITFIDSLPTGYAVIKLYAGAKERQLKSVTTFTF